MKKLFKIFTIFIVLISITASANSCTKSETTSKFTLDTANLYLSDNSNIYQEIRNEIALETDNTATEADIKNDSNILIQIYNQKNPDIIISEDQIGYYHEYFLVKIAINENDIYFNKLESVDKRILVKLNFNIDNLYLNSSEDLLLYDSITKQIAIQANVDSFFILIDRNIMVTASLNNNILHNDSIILKTKTYSINILITNTDLFFNQSFGNVRDIIAT